MNQTMSNPRRRTPSCASARIAVALLLAFGTACAIVARAGASTITVPTGTPHVDANAPLAVVVTGFRPGQNVYIEQCDGVSPTAPHWSSTLDCDNGTSPPAVIADAQGTATFAIDDVSRAFRPFEGESPSTLFNCLSPGSRALNNQLPTFTNCKVRVSSNNASATGDQVFLPIVLTGRSVSRSSGGSPSPPTTVRRASLPTSVRRPSETTLPKAAAIAGAKDAKGTTNGSPATSSGNRAAAAPATGTRAANAGSKSRTGAGLATLSDPGVRVGYLLLVIGLVIAFVPLIVRRRRNVTRAKPSGERT
jgi:hypothetical protein